MLEKIKTSYQATIFRDSSMGVHTYLSMYEHVSEIRYSHHWSM